MNIFQSKEKAKILNEKEQLYLIKLRKQATNKIQDKYEIKLKKVPKIDVSKNLKTNKEFIIQSLKAEKEEILKKKPKIQTSTMKREQKKKEEEQKAKEEAELLRKQKEEEEKQIKEWKQQFNPSMIIKSPAYFEMEKYIEMVCEGHSNFCIVEGEGGLAKTWSSQAILRKKSIDYAYCNSFTSPLELYNFLYDNSENKVILIDDTEGIWDNKAVISIIKNATELNGERIISWNSTTAKLGGRKKNCKFTSRIILLTNQLPNPEKNPHLQALVGRSFKADLKFSYKEKMDIIREVSHKKYQNLTEQERQTIYGFIERNTGEATSDLSIRTLIKLYHFYLFNKDLWKELGMKMLKADRRKEAVLTLIQSGFPVKEQTDKYFEMTGNSRADYFRIKKELYPEIKKYVKPKNEQIQKDVPLRNDGKT